MKLIIDIPEEVKQTFDDAKNEDLYGNYYDRNSLIGKAIQNGTPIDNATNGEWVDVDKRLPEYNGTYLVTVERMVGTPRVDIVSFAKNLYAVDEFDFHDKKGKSGWYSYDSEYGFWEDGKVIAWMKLPAPYQKGGKE